MYFSKLIIIIFILIYAFLSKILFDYVYKTSSLIVDEQFHLPLGEQYCHFNFDKWDPKVTTLPGLYLITSLMLGPLGLCSTYWLRMVSLLFSCVNLALFYFIASQYEKGMIKQSLIIITLSLLPPLYFLSHVYYTDVVSLTAVLLVVILSDLGLHYFASIAGFLSIICRQTNVIFLGIFAGKYVISEMYRNWAMKGSPFNKRPASPIKHFQHFLSETLRRPFRALKSMPLSFFLNTSCYLSVFICFAIFVWLNNGVVVGDRTAHEISLNLPQIFYFSVFCLVFAWPHFMGEVFNFLQFAKKHKGLIIVAFLAIVLITHYNTVVHPYLLADNRHLVFYVWNRSYGRYWWFKYFMAPIYLFSLYVLVKLIWNKKDIGFALMYIPAVSLLVITQNLVELRYFLTPYLLIRLKMPCKASRIVLELASHCIVNFITFNIFFSKTIYWDDMEGPQRIIW